MSPTIPIQGRLSFISDLHLNSMQEEKAQVLLRYLRSIDGPQSVTHLFWLGDIFDLWLSRHPFFIERYYDLVQEVRRLGSLGVQIHFFEGNHDLYLKDYWEDQLGVRVYRGPAFFSYLSKTLRIEHGDQMDPSDHGYRFLRWFLRTPVMTLLARRLPGSWVAQLGEWASRQSRKYTSQIKTIDEVRTCEIISSHAERSYSHRQFDLLIAGHVHLQHDVQTDQYRVINLGTWLEKPRVLLLNEDQVLWQDLK